jgi:hypothetical protein
MRLDTSRVTAHTSAPTIPAQINEDGDFAELMKPFIKTIVSI